MSTKAIITKFEVGLSSGKTLYGKIHQYSDDASMEDCEAVEKLFSNLNELNSFEIWAVNYRYKVDYHRPEFRHYHVCPSHIEYVVFEWEPLE